MKIKIYLLALVMSLNCLIGFAAEVHFKNGKVLNVPFAVEGEIIPKWFPSRVYLQLKDKDGNVIFQCDNNDVLYVI